jgi:hypothetical protein
MLIMIGVCLTKSNYKEILVTIVQNFKQLENTLAVDKWRPNSICSPKNLKEENEKLFDIASVIQNSIMLMKLLPDDAVPHTVFFTDGVCGQGN